MSDVSTLGLIALTIRVVGSVFFVIVLVAQIVLRFKSGDDELNSYRNLLITLTLLPLLFNFLAIYNNYIRYVEGTQNEVLNNISFVGGAVASTATAIVLWLLYKKR